MQKFMSDLWGYFESVKERIKAFNLVVINSKISILNKLT